MELPPRQGHHEGLAGGRASRRLPGLRLTLAKSGRYTLSGFKENECLYRL
jgi:hypothetical protein